MAACSAEKHLVKISLCIPELILKLDVLLRIAVLAFFQVDDLFFLGRDLKTL